MIPQRLFLQLRSEKSGTLIPAAPDEQRYIQPMAQPCPCGCGRQLGWVDRRVTKNAALVQKRLDELDTVVKPVSDRPEIGLDNYPEFVSHGEWFRDRVYEVAHGDADAGDFNREERADMNRWVLVAEKSIRYVRSNLPT